MVNHSAAQLLIVIGIASNKWNGFSVWQNVSVDLDNTYSHNSNNNIIRKRNTFVSI